MASREREKGNRLERAVVNLATDKTLDCFRTWGSNGKTRGLPEEVDVVLDENALNLWLQGKNDEKLPEYLFHKAEIQEVIEKQTGTIYVNILLSAFLDQICDLKAGRTPRALKTAPPYERQVISTLAKPNTEIGIFGQCISKAYRPLMIMIERSHYQELLSGA